MLPKSLGLSLLSLLIASSLFAQNSRSAVSVSGSDLNPCTVASPCRSFTAAMTLTSSGGEIIALTSGGYGPFTVDRSVSVLGAPGVYAGITATSGAAVVINAGAGGKTTLRNLFINNTGTASVGVSVTNSGDETSIENCIISGFSNYGVIAFLNVRVIDTTIRTCGYGIWIDNAGGPVKGSIDHVRIADIHGGTDGFATGVGIHCFRNATVSVRDSVISDAESGFRVQSGNLVAENCMVTDSVTGINVSSGVARLSNIVVTGNVTGWLNSNGTIETFANNKTRGNVTDVSNGATITTLPMN